MQPTSNLAPFFGDYVSNMLGNAQALANTQFQPFSGDRFAGPSQLQQQAFQGIGGLTTSPMFGLAGNTLSQAATMAGNNAGFTPGAFNVQGIEGLLDASNADIVRSFMNPFTQGVTDIAKRQAQTTFNDQSQVRNAAAKAAGAFGGSRHGILEGMALSDLGTQLNDIQLKGGEAAFRSAMDAINAQRSADLQRQQFNSTQNLTAQQLAEQSRQFGANLGQQGIQSLITAGTAMGNLGTAQDAAQRSIFDQQLAAGNTQQQLAQQPLDFGFQQWQQSLAFPYQQLQFQRDMLQGLPLSVNSQPAPNALLEGLMGAGGIYNLLFGGN